MPLVLEGLALHDVAPVAGGVADAKGRWACLAARAFSKASAPHGIPIHRVMRVLQQVGALLLGQAVGVHGGSVHGNPCGGQELRAFFSPSPPPPPPMVEQENDSIRYASRHGRLHSRGAGLGSSTVDKSPRHREWVTVKYGSRSVETFVDYPESPDKTPVVLVIHEIFGHTDWVEDMADEVAAPGYIAVAPDLLSRDRAEWRAHQGLRREQGGGGDRQTAARTR